MIAGDVSCKRGKGKGGFNSVSFSRDCFADFDLLSFYSRTNRTHHSPLSNRAQILTTVQLSPVAQGCRIGGKGKGGLNLVSFLGAVVDLAYSFSTDTCNSSFTSPQQ